MKARHMVFINLLFFGLMALSAGTVYQFLTGNRPLDKLFNFGGSSTAPVATNNCTAKPANTALAGVDDAQLRRLAIYQNACHSFVTDTLMTFTSMPISQEDAIATAEQIGTKIKQFAAAGVRPLVIAEPADSEGNNLDFAHIASGTYDPWFDVYFARLKSMGITDVQMGIWNPLPEANLPYWNNNKPEYFAPSVNRYLAVALNYFPKMQTSIMLNSATYETTDFNWESGDYQSLLPFIKGIRPGTITYVGLQGFPWVAPQGGRVTIINAAEFLDAGLVAEVADALKTKNVWFNTGTFGVKYALDPARSVTISPEQRRSILATVETQVAVLNEKGYTVAVNLFAKDKSKQSEETDWSYWADDPFKSLAAPVFTEFVRSLTDQKTSLWLFDD